MSTGSSHAQSAPGSGTAASGHSPRPHSAAGFSYHPVSQNEPLVNRLDASERCSRDFALARSTDHTWLGLNDLPCAPVDMTRDAAS